MKFSKLKEWAMLPIQIVLFPFWALVLFCLIMYGKLKDNDD